MNYVVRTLADIEAKRIDEDWGSLRWLAGQDIGNAQGMVVGRVIIKKGRSNPKHSHPNCEEMLYLLCGRLEHTVGEENVITEAGDVIVVPAGVPHVARNIGDEDADMIVAYSAGIRGFRLEE